MKQLVNGDRIRSLIANCYTEKAVSETLRLHKIRHHYTTETGTLSIKVPCRKGSIYITRVVSRSAPYIIRSAPPVPWYKLPTLYNE